MRRAEGRGPLLAAALGVLLLPLFYRTLAVTPWARDLFGASDRGAYFAVVGTILLLHGMALLFVALAGRWIGLTQGELGLPRGPLVLVRLCAIGTVAGIVLIALRAAIPGSGQPPTFQIPLAPQSIPERLLWVPASLIAGISEELVFRAFGIAVLRRAGLPMALAVALPSLAWVFIHGQLPPVLVAIYFLTGLAFAGLFLWRGLPLAAGVHAGTNLLLLARP